MNCRPNSGELLFVYGTLMRGGSLHAELGDDVRYLQPGKIRGRLFAIPGEDYPGAIPSHRREYVHGELYEMNNALKVLNRLDAVEGCAEGLFVRRRVPVWSRGRRFAAWTYFYNLPHEGLVKIKDGRYPLHS